MQHEQIMDILGHHCSVLFSQEETEPNLQVHVDMQVSDEPEEDSHVRRTSTATMSADGQRVNSFCRREKTWYYRGPDICGCAARIRHGRSGGEVAAHTARVKPELHS
eukprot:TRINITY_DN19237_c0_g1_i2.p2 TRINITY_DN19237_c0_g1~~TRINITY_DN19237_c0_g1_i2.p2  ORF type:complete len:107 (+),score=11.81 TRINITY_DN19237_c0_g1_i2:192-512(+)